MQLSQPTCNQIILFKYGKRIFDAVLLEEPLLLQMQWRSRRRLGLELLLRALDLLWYEEGPSKIVKRKDFCII